MWKKYAKNCDWRLPEGSRLLCDAYFDYAMELSWTMGEAVIVYNYLKAIRFSFIVFIMF